jgi:hypothetical protein
MSVRGRVINPLTGAGVEGIKMQINRNISGTIEGGMKEVKTDYTDADGTFSMDRLGVFEYHEVQANDIGGNYALGWYSESGELLTKAGAIELRKGKTTRANYYVVPFGKLKLNVVNQNCEGINDSFVVNTYNSIPGYYDSFNPSTYNGCFSNFGSFYDVPMGWYKFYGVVNRNGVMTAVSDSVYLEAGGEATLNMFY